MTVYRLTNMDTRHGSQDSHQSMAQCHAASTVLEDVPTTSSHSHPSAQGSAGCTSPSQSHLTASSVEPQHEPVLTPVFSNVTVAHVLDSSFSVSGSPGIIPHSAPSILH
jgi:hypothetical protein